MKESPSVKTPAVKSSDSGKFHGASIIDSSGREIPITEAMVQDSLHKLIRAWENQHHK